MLSPLSASLLSCLLWFHIEHSSNEYIDSNTICDCDCDVQVDVVRTFLQELKAVRKREDEILAEISLVKAKLQTPDKQSVGGNSAPSTCVEAAAESFKSGVYQIQLKKFSDSPFAVFCNEDTDYGGWLVIQRRVSDSVDFYRDWQQYKDGFGQLDGNYWIGLEKLHALTSSCPQELYIELENFSGASYHARYSEFLVGSESDGYPLKELGDYTGTAGDSLKQHVGMKFTTRDRDNDFYRPSNCAVEYKSAWWFKACHHSHLNGRYGRKEQGLLWNSLRNSVALKSSLLMIRPTEKCLRRLMLRKS